jgi:Zn-dependent peptidase ImmA (M78 family)/transcriptional regulator with XRE-family HTH domain
MVEAFITREMIGWAMERVHETPISIARKLNVKPEKIAQWQSGDTRPSIRQAQELAKKLRIPFGYLYLKTPREEKLPLPDLRSVTGTISPSPDFLDVLYDAFRKQQWYHDYLEQDNASPIPFIGRFNLNDDTKTIAVDISKTLNISNYMRQECNSWEQFLTEFIRRAERARVLVLRSGIVGSNTHRQLNVQEFRGFAISDDLAPLVFINGRDYKTAQIFTLAHELAHLWIGQSGISNPDYMLRSKEQRHRIDQVCDSIAAEVLIPSVDFLLRWDDSYELDDNLDRIARKYRVSTFVVLRRAYEFGKIQRELFVLKYGELLGRVTRKKTDDGGDYYKLVLSRNSRTFTSALVVATGEGRVLPKEAAALLNIRVSKLRAIENSVLASEFMHV